MARKTCICGICESINFPSVCAACVNCRLNDKYKWINVLKHECDSLHKRLDEKLKAKDKAGEQRRWMQIHAEKNALLKERLRLKKDQLLQEKSKLEEKIDELCSGETLLADAFNMLETNTVEKLKKFYPDVVRAQKLGHEAIRLELLQKQSIVIRQLNKVFPLCKVLDGEGKKDRSSSNNYHQICNVRLPLGTSPHSVSAEELGASLGYMLRLLDLVVCYLYAPLLLNSALAVSCSRVWQRGSYWDSRPSSRSKELPLFIQLENCSTASQENSWSEKSSSNYGVASMESPGKPHLENVGSSSFKYGSSSLRSNEKHKDVEEGIYLLKKSVACVTAYVFNLFSLPSPTQLSTFEAFEKMLGFVISKDARALLSSNEAKSRCRKQMQQANKLGVDQSVVDSRISSSSLEESKPAKVVMPNRLGVDQSTAASRILSSSLEESKHAKVETKPRAGDGSSQIQVSDLGKAESVIDGFFMVEHPTVPSPSSQSEDIEQWTRAMIIDAKRR